MLVGDRDRDLAARALRRHFVRGRLTTAELSERVERTLRARSRDDLRAALRGLPPVWEDLPGGVQAVADRVRRRARRVRLFFVLARIWFRVNLALALAFGVAVAVGAPAGTTFGAVVAAWALATIAVWRVWRVRTSRGA